MRIVAIIQARMGSTRLPGKVLMEIHGKPLLSYVVNRTRLCPAPEDAVVATSDQPAESPIADFCRREGISVFRGELDDVLSRYRAAAMEHRADAVVRITGDCPLIDPGIIGRVVSKFCEGGFDYVSNVLTRTYPRGLDAEVLSRDVIDRLHHNPQLTAEDREHVVLYIRNHPQDFHLGSVIHTEDHSDLRWTVDTPADFVLIQKIYAHFHGNMSISWIDVLAAYAQHPEWRDINSDIPQKSRF